MYYDLLISEDQSFHWRDALNRERETKNYKSSQQQRTIKGKMFIAGGKHSLISARRKCEPTMPELSLLKKFDLLSDSF